MALKAEAANAKSITVQDKQMKKEEQIDATTAAENIIEITEPNTQLTTKQKAQEQTTYNESTESTTKKQIEVVEETTKRQRTVEEEKTTRSKEKLEKTKTVTITNDEYDYICRIVMGEAGNEPYDGQILVAQCLYNAMAESGKNAWDVKKTYGYCGSTSKAPTESVKKAVSAVFYEGYKYTDAKVLFFYAPRYCTGEWHETQKFICQVGGHRFFARW